MFAGAAGRRFFTSIGERMSTGTTSDTIIEPRARDIAVFFGRDERNEYAFLVQVTLEGGGRIEFAVKEPDVLNSASVAFATAAARDAQTRRYRLEDLAKVTNRDLDIEEAGDDELISYVTDVRAAVERAL